jgi:FlaA1/EpsC-like NDP-sugar epimerase
MGQQVKIAELAKTMIQLSGLIPGRDIQIVYTGLRPGEKLYEELLTDKENTIPTHHKKIKKAHVEKIDSAIIVSRIDDLLNNLYSFSKEEVVNKIRDLVPEYKSSNGSYKEKSAELSAEGSEQKAENNNEEHFPS